MNGKKILKERNARVYAELEFRKIAAQMGSLSPSGYLTTSLDALNQLKKLEATSPGYDKGLHYVWLLLFFAASLAYQNGIQSPLDFVPIFLRWNKGTDLEEGFCLVRLPQNLQDIFLPPFDCSICKNLTIVPKISSLTKDEFAVK